MAGDKFTAAQRFKTDLSKISQSSDNKISIIFGKVDIDFVQKVKDEGDADLLEEIEDFPVCILIVCCEFNKLYLDCKCFSFFGANLSK